MEKVEICGCNIGGKGERGKTSQSSSWQVGRVQVPSTAANKLLATAVLPGNTKFYKLLHQPIKIGDLYFSFLLPSDTA